MTEEDYNEMYDERAAIFEYLGEFSRPEAERRAAEFVRIERLRRGSAKPETQGEMFAGKGFTGG